VGALQALGLAGAGLVAGAVNAVAGSGSLITFPALLALGYPPVVANVSNTVGLLPGSLSGVAGYRPELAGQGRRLARLAPLAVAGGLGGAALLLRFQGSFQAVVPGLVLAAVAMVVAQPALARLTAGRRAGPTAGGPVLGLAVAATAVYGGYLGAAQGVLLVGVLGLGLGDGLQRLNALKNALVSLVNGVAALVFAALAPVAWRPALVLAGSSALGGTVGARLGRRVPPAVLRALIAAAGLAAAVKLLA
jgi:uncharacterized membrane protein YfcA